MILFGVGGAVLFLMMLGVPKRWSSELPSFSSQCPPKATGGADNQLQIPKWDAGGAPARIFTGDRTRVFPQDDVKLKSFDPTSVQSRTASDVKLELWCEKWGVVTTIRGVSEAVRRQVG